MTGWSLLQALGKNKRSPLSPSRGTANQNIKGKAMKTWAEKLANSLNKELESESSPYRIKKGDKFYITKERSVVFESESYRASWEWLKQAKENV
jgi:hypothetical protein